MIYLDNNATTSLDPRVLEAMMACWKDGPLNPSSQHALGRRARKKFFDAIEASGQRLGASVGAVGGDRWIVTSGGTEANQLAIQGLCAGRTGPIVVSRIEHPSVLENCKRLAERTHRELIWLESDRSGRVSLDSLRTYLNSGQPTPAFATLMGANNETGVLQPVAELVSLCRPRGIPVHSDASQMIGKAEVDFGPSGLTAMTISPHKFHGPVGTGALVVAAGTPLPSLWDGGGQQLETRPGTEAVAMTVGVEVAIRFAMDELVTAQSEMVKLRDRFESLIQAEDPSVVIQGRGAERLPNTSLISFPGIDRQALLMRLDLAGVACSTGSACSSGSSRPSHVLLAMNVPADQVDSAIRFSLSKFTTEAEIHESANRISLTVNKLRRG